MNRVKKRSGELQEFDRTRLTESMKRAGADERIAKDVAEKMFVAEGTPTAEIRKHVADELRKVNPSVAEAYQQTLRLRAKAKDDVQAGTAKVPKKIERVPDVKPGQTARVRHEDKRFEVRIEPTLEAREVWLSRGDLTTLGAPEGTRVAVRFLREGSSVPTPVGAGKPAFIPQMSR